MADGARWEYQHDDWTETVTLSATTFNGEPAYLMSDSPNPSDDLRADSIISVADGAVARMTKEEFFIPLAGDPVLRSSVTYGTGFTRFKEDWATQQVGFKESLSYVRVETPPAGTAQPGEDRSHTFELLDLSDEVMTTVGTFDCIKIRRSKDWQAVADGVDVADAQTKLFWFARGVGKVREENEDSGSFEQLSDYEIPE